MLTSLSISNYALISELNITFCEGLTIITGETGAGKSILLGALSLVLGQRADTGVLKDASSNAIVEAQFHIRSNETALRSLFESIQMDFSSELLVRRVITPTGKSRAFVNDEPVPLSFLKELAPYIIDIHSQHEHLLLSSNDYALRFVDACAATAEIAKAYTSVHEQTRQQEQEVAELSKRVQSMRKEQDYLSFQLGQLQQAHLKSGEQSMLEEQQQRLEYAEELQQSLYLMSQSLEEDPDAILTRMRDVLHQGRSVAHHYPFDAVVERLEQVRIELKDIDSEVKSALSKVQVDPQQLEQVQQRLDLIYSLERKHNVKSDDELLKMLSDLESRSANMDEDILKLERGNQLLSQMQNERAIIADTWHDKRVALTDELSTRLKERLALLGMPHAQVLFQWSRDLQYGPLGNTRLELLFSANKDVAPRELAKVASGGELSRLMLCIKSLMAKNSGLETLVFDEIDVGVSGRIADSMGVMIGELAHHLQVLAITHLPQVAAKGDVHLLVSKHTLESQTNTQVKELNAQERVMEVARMLSGSRITDAAVANAKELINNK